MRALCLAACSLAGCAVVVQGAPLSGRPLGNDKILLSTGDADRPYETLGFMQATVHGLEAFGLIEINAGEVALDAAIHEVFVEEARKLNGDGVIHIEFLDVDPRTPAEQVQQFAESAEEVRRGELPTQIDRRTLVVQGQIIKFLE